MYRTSQNIRIINVFLESLLSESLSSLGVTVHFITLGCCPTLCWSLDLLWGQLRFQSGPTPVCSCLQCPQLSELVCFLLWELSIIIYIFHRHRVCLVDHVDLTCSLYSWWEDFGSSYLGTLPLSSIMFYFHLCMWVVHWGLLLRLPWRTWVFPSGSQVWTWYSCMHGSQGFWLYQVLRGVGSYNSRKYNALEGQSTGSQRIGCDWKNSRVHKHKIFFF